MRARRGVPVWVGLPGVLLHLTEGNNLGYRQGTRVHFFPGSSAPVNADLGPPCSRPARYHFHAFVGGLSPMLIFLTVRSRCLSARQIVANPADVGNASRHSASVASGCAVTKPFRRSSWPANTRRRNVVCVRGAMVPVSRQRCLSAFTHATLTWYRSANPETRSPPQRR